MARRSGVTSGRSALHVGTSRRRHERAPPPSSGPSTGRSLRMTQQNSDGDRRNTIARFFAAVQSGDRDVLLEVLTPGAVTRWPQSGERISGAMSCVSVYRNYPGGPPEYRVVRVSGEGALWVAELAADYGAERWHV